MKQIYPIFQNESSFKILKKNIFTSSVIDNFRNNTMTKIMDIQLYVI